MACPSRRSRGTRRRIPSTEDDDLHRCHGRWLFLWAGIESFLQAEFPHVWRRLCLVLARHGLAHPFGTTRQGLTEIIPDYGAISWIRPSDEAIERTRAFANDPRLASDERKRPGRAGPSAAILGKHAVLRDRLRAQGVTAPAEQAWESLARRFESRFRDTDSFKAAVRKSAAKLTPFQRDMLFVAGAIQESGLPIGSRTVHVPPAAPRKANAKIR